MSNTVKTWPEGATFTIHRFFIDSFSILDCLHLTGATLSLCMPQVAEQRLSFSLKMIIFNII